MNTREFFNVQDLVDYLEFERTAGIRHTRIIARMKNFVPHYTVLYN